MTTQTPTRSIAFLTMLITTSAFALDAYDPDGDSPPDPYCIANLVVNKFTAPARINLGQAATVEWSVRAPPSCTTLKIKVAGQLVGRSGSLTFYPQADSTYVLTATYSTTVRSISQAKVAVTLPSTVNIQSNDQVSLFVQALRTDDTIIVVDDAVNMNLSYKDGLTIAQGVKLLGGRNSRVAGARFYTATRPGALFVIRGDNVRISGVRIEGAEMGIGDGDDNLSQGIRLASVINVEIDHCELSGWTNTAVAITDPSSVGDRINPLVNPHTVRIHDNYIHHNQFYAKFGYGVPPGEGAYVLIDRNVFDWNRHAIASSGQPNTGYHAYHNLVLEHGGYHRWWGWPFGWDRTHQFDMHGTDSCGIGDVFSDAVYNCGWGGHSLEVKNNAFLYTEAPAFKLRGTPFVSNGAKVIENVFKHSNIDDAVQQTQSGLVKQDNLTGVDGMNELGTCDFDGDGVDDKFLATGQNWWFSSGGTGAWNFLRGSLKRRAQVALGYFDSRAGCDVSVDGTVYSGGKDPITLWMPMISTSTLAP